MIRTLNQWKRARWTWMVVAVLWAIHFGSEFTTDADKTTLYLTFAASRAGLEKGFWWSLFTYGFLHGSWMHFFCNALMVVIIGVKLEGWLSLKHMSSMSLLGLLGGSCCHIACGGRSTDLLVGASGVVMAQLLVFCSLSPQSRMFPIPISAKNLGLGLMISSCILMLVNPAAAIPGFSQIGILLSRKGLGDWFAIGHACHFGGAISGYLYARWLLRVPITREKMLEQRARNERRQMH
jgi:membrane associated rhomboid family serine protease